MPPKIRKGGFRLIKRFCVCALSALLLMTLAACQTTEREQTAEEIQSQLQEIASLFPSTETGNINVSQRQEGGFAAVVDMTWGESTGRYTTERTIDQYSLDFAATASETAYSLSELTLSWTVPYHSETEPSIEITFGRRDDWLQQTDIQDRFTDNTFGADAFTLAAHPSESSQTTRRDTVTLPLSEDALASMHVPHHKVLRLPVTHEPRHKAYRKMKSFLPRHKTGPVVLVEDLTEQQLAAAEAAGNENPTAENEAVQNLEEETS